MSKVEKLFRGKWHIQEMAKWSKSSINLVGQANISFEDEEMGSFLFIAVKGFMDCRYTTQNDRPRVEFSWQGLDERDEVNGRGWAEITSEDKMDGHIFIHCGEDSSFSAVRSPNQMKRTQL